MALASTPVDQPSSYQRFEAPAEAVRMAHPLKQQDTARLSNTILECCAPCALAQELGGLKANTQRGLCNIPSCCFPLLGPCTLAAECWLYIVWLRCVWTRAAAPPAREATTATRAGGGAPERHDVRARPGRRGLGPSRGLTERDKQNATERDALHSSNID